MAQSQNNVPADTSAADLEAWLIAAANRKYRIYNGQVWSGCPQFGIVFPLPPVPGFSLLPESSRSVVFVGAAQFVTNRVGQTAEGNVAEAVSDALTKSAIPSANTNDAFDRHFMAVVTERVKAAKPVPDLPRNASEDQKKEHAAAVAAQEVAIEATYRVNRFDSDGKTDSAKFLAIVREGIAAAKARPITEKKKRVGKAADTSAAIDL